MHKMNKRLTVSLPKTLYQQIVLTSKSEDKSMSKFVADELNRILEEKSKAQLKKQYEALDKLRGSASGGSDDPMLSQSIDKILYGENGAWRGEQ